MSAFNKAWDFLKAVSIPDELRAGQFDTPAEQERKEMAIRQLREQAYENDPRTIASRQAKKEKTMAEMDREAEEYRKFYGDELPEP
jgi:hypothetical protein